jgi:hypothetical protein
MNTREQLYNVQERLIASRQYMLSYDLLGRATSEIRRDASRIALELSSKESVLGMAPIWIDDDMLQLVHAAAATLPGSTVWRREMMLFPSGLITAQRPLMLLSQQRDIVASQWVRRSWHRRLRLHQLGTPGPPFSRGPEPHPLAIFAR